ncbi:MAG: hypothetical protein RIQ59_1581 [Bacteroidota bacterium]|jgi:hypothetical protein
MKIKIILFLLVITTLCNAQIVSIPDAIFKSRLVNSNVQNERAKNLLGNYFAIDANADGEIQVSEAAQVSYIYISQNDGYGIYSLEGINDFPNLNYFSCSDANLYELDIHGLQYLELINVIYSGINIATLYNLPSLKTLDLWYNTLTELDVSNLTSLLSLNCYENSLTSLDVSMLINLNTLTCNNNQLVSLYMKNGRNQTFQNGIIQGYIGSPTLRFICVDESELTYVQNIVSTIEGSQLVVINDYCTFVPGGEYFTVNGYSKIDFNANGCDTSNTNYPNLKFIISNGINSGTFYSNQAGLYSYSVQAGSHTISPTLENPSYFNVNPTSFPANFPTALSPLVQNICITPNGIHNDLEIALIPINAARPGFDSHYKLIYKNKGTTTQSGTINFTFDDSVLDLVSNNPNFSNQSTGNLTWNFTNLLPFESREINLVLNLNSPTETPALNSGDILNFSATVNGQTDETPNDNNAILNQIVVNSYDPNDKTCMEGTTITPNMVGDYVHYLIRFENNGTANAQNIIVKDMIDTNKLDINTLIPIKGSHNFETRISSTNKVEFIFQNINLPFDNANNDGYVSFKIKTKSNLVVGNTFSNSANIYFDYNFPIVTNNYTTTIQNSLGIKENDFINNISVYPNPVKDILNFKTEHNISKVEVYDIAGRILSSNSISENKINLSELKTGNYILKIYTEKGIMNTKIMKE